MIYIRVRCTPYACWCEWNTNFPWGIHIRYFTHIIITGYWRKIVGNIFSFDDERISGSELFDEWRFQTFTRASGFYFCLLILLINTLPRPSYVQPLSRKIINSSIHVLWLCICQDVFWMRGKPSDSRTSRFGSIAQHSSTYAGTARLIDFLLSPFFVYFDSGVYIVLGCGWMWVQSVALHGSFTHYCVITTKSSAIPTKIKINENDENNNNHLQTL